MLVVRMDADSTRKDRRPFSSIPFLKHDAVFLKRCTKAMAQDDRKSAIVSCQRCCHYQVTWDMQKPYGCRAHGFKSRRNPALVVFESSGVECQLFEPKKRPRAARQE